MVGPLQNISERERTVVAGSNRHGPGPERRGGERANHSTRHDVGREGLVVIEVPFAPSTGAGKSMPVACSYPQHRLHATHWQSGDQCGSRKNAPRWAPGSVEQGRTSGERAMGESAGRLGVAPGNGRLGEGDGLGDRRQLLPRATVWAALGCGRAWKKQRPCHLWARWLIGRKALIAKAL